MELEKGDGSKTVQFSRDNTEQIPFWEEIYRNEDVNAFPAEPNGTILEFEHFLKKNSAILEAGCGEGQNVRYLAENGYSDIDAFDLSEAGISKLIRICERDGLRINAFVDDLSTFQFMRSYDLVMTFATLCFVEKDKWKHFIADAKEHTNLGGIHIIHTFTNMVPASPDIAPFAVGLADEGEIKDLYSDWEVLQFKTYVFDDEHPNVPKHQHAVNKLVARKKASC